MCTMCLRRILDDVQVHNIVDTPPHGLLNNRLPLQVRKYKTTALDLLTCNIVLPLGVMSVGVAWPSLKLWITD
jgi:hypothetical protein